MSSIHLKMIKSDDVYHSGYGAGSGSIITEVYECVCGKGTVTYEKDDIPGFRDRSISVDCVDCRKKYDFSWNSITEKKS